MNRLFSLAALVVPLGLVVATPALAQAPPIEMQLPRNGAPPAAVAPAVADQTLGMALMSAAVNSAGTLLRGSSAVSAIRNSAGIYRVVFNRDVKACVTSATIASDVVQPIPYPVSTTPWTDNTVYVRMESATDRDFHLLVFCHQ